MKFGKRPMWLWFLALCGGILAAAGEQREMKVAGCLVLGCLLILALCQKNKVLLLGSVAFFVGGLLAVGHVPPLGTLEGESALYGVVISCSTDETGQQTIVLELEEVYQAVEIFAEKGRVSVFLPEGVSVEPGQELVVKGELSIPSLPKNPGGFDGATYAKANGLQYQCYADEVIVCGSRELTVSQRIALAREKVLDVYEQVLLPTEASLMQAMVAGSSATLTDEVRQMYNDGGIAHVLAVSGLHTSLFAAMLLGLLNKVLPLPRRVALVVVMVVLAGYTVFAGARPSIVRAAVMAELVFGAALLGRESDGFHSMGIAGILLLLANPYALFTAGFQLSFLTTGAFLFSGSYLLKEKGMGNRIKGYLQTTFLVTLLSAPLVLWHFYRLPVYGVFVNALVLPLLSLLLGLGFLVGLVGLVSLPLAHFLAGSVYGILQFYNLVTGFFTSLPGAVLVTGRPPLFGILLFYGLVAFVLFFGVDGIKRKMVWAMGTALLAFFVVSPLRFATSKVLFLDVGQGSSSLLFTQSGHTFVVDAGGWPLAEVGENTGEKVVSPALEYFGRSEIDGLFVTHLDRDHALGALELLSLYPVDTLYLPETTLSGEMYQDLLTAAKQQGTEVELLSAGQVLRLSDTESISVLSPYRVKMWPETDDNRTCLVLKYEVGENSLLWMGDGDMQTEKLLLFADAPLKSDVVVLGHHGAATSSSAEFLEATGADIAIVSAGENNTYGHPAEETVDRCRNAGITVYETATNGALSIQSDGTTWRLEGAYHETTEGRTKE